VHPFRSCFDILDDDGHRLILAIETREGRAQGCCRKLQGISSCSPYYLAQDQPGSKYFVRKANRLARPELFGVRLGYREARWRVPGSPRPEITHGRPPVLINGWAGEAPGEHAHLDQAGWFEAGAPIVCSKAAARCPGPQLSFP